MEINDTTKFGFCRGCQKWKPRESLVSTNIRIYGEGVDNIDDLIRLRLCPECHEEQRQRWLYDGDKSLEWEPTLVEARHIRVDREKAAQCDEVDFDDSEVALVVAAH